MRAGSALLFLACAAPLHAQQTRAERSGYTETSSHADVQGFLDSLEALGARIRRGTLATSPQGRTVPWAIAARPMVDGPAEAHRSGRLIVYLQGNIHGGEIEGKEAALMLLRDLTLGSLRPLLDSLVLIVVPIYNPDGNDAFGPAERQRPGQNGPAIVGLRSNGQGLDLNRDYVKQEAPETRGAAQLLNYWDPDLFIDLHTTNGSYHGYVLTYSPGLNPDSPPANEYVRDRFLPEVRRRMRERHRQEVYWYGNFRNQQPDSLTRGWETYDGRPRYGTNWYGMRGRLAILSEAYSNADLRTRVSASYNFVLEILRLAVEERGAILELTRTGVPRPDSITVRSTLAPPRQDDVIAEITEAAGDGTGGFARRRRTGVYRTIRMPVFDRFAPLRREPFRPAYVFPPQHAHLAEALRRHGVRVGRLLRPLQTSGEAFRVDSVIASPNVFEGHREVRVEGAWRASEVRAGAGWFLVSTEQRLGPFAAYLLEPGSEDGFASWNQLDRDLRRGRDAPVLRLNARPTVPSEELP
jgi:hypothetical protein